jgi:hypothetical protein
VEFLPTDLAEKGGEVKLIRVALWERNTHKIFSDPCTLTQAGSFMSLQGIQLAVVMAYLQPDLVGSPSGGGKPAVHSI